MGAGGIVTRYTAVYAIRQRAYAKLLLQVMIRNARVYMRFQELLADQETHKPYTDTAVHVKVPRALEFADPDDGRTRFFDFQVAGILQSQIKEGLPQ